MFERRTLNYNKCGQRNLYDEIDEKGSYKTIDVDISDDSFDSCIWRLYDTSNLSTSSIDWYLYFLLNETVNADLFLIVQKDPKFEGRGYVIEAAADNVRNLTQVQEENGLDSYIYLGWKELPH